MPLLSDAPRSARYAPGGDIYNSLASSYGTAGADKVYRVQQSGGDIAGAIATLKHGAPLNDSTASNLAKQLANDPFAAPLESANRQLFKVGLNFLKNPFAALAILAIAVAVAWAYVPGARSFFARLTAK